jgi:hypothetical protein
MAGDYNFSSFKFVMAQDITYLVECLCILKNNAIICFFRVFKKLLLTLSSCVTAAFTEKDRVEYASFILPIRTDFLVTFLKPLFTDEY